MGLSPEQQEQLEQQALEALRAGARELGAL
jgi:hypothetical protein